LSKSLQADPRKKGNLPYSEKGARGRVIRGEIGGRINKDILF
jgi:hypothetical protein